MSPLACLNLLGPEQGDGDLRLFWRHILRIGGKIERTEKNTHMGSQRGH